MNRFNKLIMSVFMLLTVLTGVAQAVVPANAENIVEEQVMYRLYNPNSGEHFYTASKEERNHLYDVGWSYESIGWIAPLSSDAPVYRLYNANGGEHHYTLDADERDMLINAGWNYEGIGWYSDGNCTVPLYREYNPNAFSCNHNYTTDKSENDYLVSLGWRFEGIGWYAAREKTASDVEKDDLPVGLKPVQPVTPGYPATGKYVININSGLFHYPDCDSVKRMNEANKRYFEGSRDELIRQGYRPCSNCNP